MQSLLTDDVNLAAGTYCVMIDPVWNESVADEGTEEFKSVLLDIYAPEKVDIEVLAHEEGMLILAQSLKHAAMKLSPPEKKVKYLEDRPDYNKVIRVQDLDMLNCWYGFIYTNNLSSSTLEEEMKPQLEGLEVVYPQMDGDKIDINIKANQEHIIILRRYSTTCRYNT